MDTPPTLAPPGLSSFAPPPSPPPGSPSSSAPPRAGFPHLHSLVLRAGPLCVVVGDPAIQGGDRMAGSHWRGVGQGSQRTVLHMASKTWKVDRPSMCREEGRGGESRGREGRETREGHVL